MKEIEQGIYTQNKMNMYIKLCFQQDILHGLH